VLTPASHLLQHLLLQGSTIVLRDKEDASAQEFLQVRPTRGAEQRGGLSTAVKGFGGPGPVPVHVCACASVSDSASWRRCLTATVVTARRPLLDVLQAVQRGA
jgi:hypothetical protein